MSEDLERQLDEMGPEYRAVVMRLRRAACPGKADGKNVRTDGWGIGRSGWRIAASALVAVGLAAIFLPSFRGKPRPADVIAETAHMYRLAEIRDDAAMKEMIRTQNPDGSWQNDFLTRRNAEALRTSTLPDAAVAYKKAMRNLRLRGRL